MAPSASKQKRLAEKAAKQAEDDAAAKKAAEELKKKIQEETKAKLEEATKKSEKLPIRFKDAVGRKFSFPFHLCATWAVRCSPSLPKPNPSPPFEPFEL